MRTLPLVALTMAFSVALSGCSVVRSSQVREDYDVTDRQRVKRLVVVVQPLPAEDELAGELWGLITQRYVNLKRDFIVKELYGVDAPAADADPSSHCGEGVEGVLWLTPLLAPEGDRIRAEVEGLLVRCYDGEWVWQAEGAGVWAPGDEGLENTREAYVADLGPEIRAYFVPTWRLLVPVLETLPNPLLTDADKDEKIEYDAI